ncbi:MAG: glycine--tRNA ligase subunit beta, partial [Vitreoscilla sp.]
MTTATNDFRSLLVELVCEELPPKALKRLGEVFADELGRSLLLQGLAELNAERSGFASPRRLGVHISAVSAKAHDQAKTVKLMPVAVAY